MVLPGETIALGASPRCSDCGVMPPIKVHRSAAGYYIGTWCACGPYSRESGYYASADQARGALVRGDYGR
jgi:hypothetical protein